MSAPARQAGREWKRIELQLDTAQIVLVLVMLAALCAVSFYLGRWIERDRWAGEAGRKSGPTGAIAQTDAGADLTFFDTLGNRKGVVGEPGREARPVRPAPTISTEAADGPVASEPPAGSPRRTEAAAGAAGPASAFAVQVFAGERAQAEKIVSSLTRKGYAAKAIPAGPGSSGVRVRVYGYATRAEADRAAARILKEERLSPWVVKAD